MAAVAPRLRVRSRAGGRALAVVAALFGLAGGGVGGVNAWVAVAARGHGFASVAAVPARSVAIVPGSRVVNGRPLAILRDRLEAALALYREGRVRAVLVSGDDTPAAPEATVMRAWLLARGVPAGDVWSDGGGSRTRETMNRAAALYDVKDAVICTQTLNMPRTLFLARAAGIDAVGVALPTNLSRRARFVAEEALKTTLAVVESVVREGPEGLAAERSRRTAIAAR